MHIINTRTLILKYINGVYFMKFFLKKKTKKEKGKNDIDTYYTCRLMWANTYEKCLQPQ